jgi:hypothetical protein
MKQKQHNTSIKINKPVSTYEMAFVTKGIIIKYLTKAIASVEQKKSHR